MLQIVLAITFCISELFILTNGFSSGFLFALPVIDKSLQNALFSSNITIGIFAANFSFIAYQFTPYKAVLNKIPKRQILLASSVLFLSILPLIISQVLKCILVEMLVINIPLLCYLSIQLILLTIHESSPLQIIKRSQSLREIGTYISTMNDINNSYEIKPPELETEREVKVPPPLHELNISLIKAVPPNNPFSSLASVLKISIECKDAEAFENVIKTFINLYINANKIHKKEGLFRHISIEAQAKSHIIQELSLLEREIQNSKNIIFLDRYISKMILFYLSLKEPITHESMIKIMLSLTHLVCGSMLWSGKRQSLILLTVIRQELTRYYESLTEPLDVLQQFKPNSYITMLKLIGESAADNDERDLLYRSLEALGWLGCTVARLDDIIAGKQIMLALVQIGRKSKKNNMECHWDKCALLPIDHAIERLEWICSWVIKLDAQNHGHWASALSDAFSRLKGYKCVVNFIADGDQFRISIVETKEEKYVINYRSSATGTIDFSDISILKEFDIM